jgi:hypothetical protein
MRWIPVLLISVGLCFAQVPKGKRPDYQANLTKVAAAGGGGGADVTENFEGTGYETAWTEETGNPNEDQATTGLGLEASQCVYLQGEAQQQQTYSAFTASDKLYSYFLFRFENVPSGANRRQIAIKNGTTTLCEIAVDIGPLTWKVFDSALGDAGSFISVDTTYHVWFEYEKGTGANGIVRLYFSTDGTKPGTADCEITNSAETSQANRFYIGGWSASSGDYYVDKVRLSRTTAFGSNPS